MEEKSRVPLCKGTLLKFPFIRRLTAISRETAKKYPFFFASLRWHYPNQVRSREYTLLSALFRELPCNAQYMPGRFYCQVFIKPFPGCGDFFAGILRFLGLPPAASSRQLPSLVQVSRCRDPCSVRYQSSALSHEISHQSSVSRICTNSSRPARSSSVKRPTRGLSMSRTPTIRSPAWMGTTISELDAPSQAMWPGNWWTS